MAFGVAGRLAEWQKAGLIDADVADRIAAFEAAHRGNSLARAMIVLSCFTLAMGIIASVAANWHEIPILVRLTVHMAINLGLGGLVWHWTRNQTDGMNMQAEGGILLLSLSTLSLIAHVGQSFQLQGSVSAMVGTWLLLVTPFTITLAKGWANRWMWQVGVVIWLFNLLTENNSWVVKHSAESIVLALVVAAHYALRTLPPPFPVIWARHMARAGVLMTLGITLFWGLLYGADTQRSWTLDHRAELASGAVVGMVALAIAHLLDRNDRSRSGLAIGALLVSAPLVTIAPVLLPGPVGGVVAALFFCLFWVAMAWLALLKGRIGWFRLAFMVVAIRIFVIYLEATGGLLNTGIGLLIAGLLLLAMGWAAHRVERWGAGR